MGTKPALNHCNVRTCETRYSTTRLPPGQCGQIHETLKGSAPPSSAITDPALRHVGSLRRPKTPILRRQATAARPARPSGGSCRPDIRQGGARVWAEGWQSQQLIKPTSCRQISAANTGQTGSTQSAPFRDRHRGRARTADRRRCAATEDCGHTAPPPCGSLWATG